MWLHTESSRPAKCSVVLVAAALLAACSSGGKGVLSGVTATERIFIEAAATWDLDKDGAVTCDEWKSYAAGLMREADRNRDGQLTRDEFQRLGETDRLFQVAGFEHFDRDRNGAITAQEMAEAPNPAFTRMDANNDCRLDGGEIALPGPKPTARNPRHPEGNAGPDRW
jgi:Ca2+-binding EF-hand superfamily protein